MSSDEIQFSRWMPSDAQETCIDLLSTARSAGHSQAPHVLQRLATRLEMKDAWNELKHFPNRSPGELLWAAFTIWVCALHNHYLHKFPSYADSSLREHAIQARGVANGLRAIDPADRADEGITDTMVTESDRVAAYFERKAEIWDKGSKVAWPPRKAGARNALQIAFVNTMCGWLRESRGRRPYTLVAILTNVTFNVPADQPWDADWVKKCYASRSRKK